MKLLVALLVALLALGVARGEETQEGPTSAVEHKPVKCIVETCAG
jgi:hypothetical protein